MVNYGGQGVYDQGTATFELPAQLADDCFALRGPLGAGLPGRHRRRRRRRHRAELPRPNVYLVVGGTGNVTVTRDGKTTTIPVSGPPNMRQIVADDEDGAGHVDVSLSKGLQAFSFTYG